MQKGGRERGEEYGEMGEEETENFLCAIPKLLKSTKRCLMLLPAKPVGIIKRQANNSDEVQ